MNSKLSFGLTYFLVILSFTSFAQGKVSNSMETLANKYYSEHEYDLALPLYIDLDGQNPGQGEYNYRIGYCYYNSHHKMKALPYFEKAEALKNHPLEINFLLARSYHLTHQFDKAIYYYEKYQKSLLSNPTQTSPAKPEVDKSAEPSDLVSVTRYIEMCKVGKELIADSLIVEIKNMGPTINTEYPEYGPVITADESVLMFTSRRPGTTGGTIDPADGQYYEDIYVTTKVTKTKWLDPSNLKMVNTELHDACIALSPDGQKLFIYRTSKNSKKRTGDIYVSNLEGVHWSEPVVLKEVVNHVSWETSISLSADQKTMYFTSDRPGGFGGTDIYMVKMQPDGHWGAATNLGPTINTSFDEEAPFIHPDNKTLSFSSDGHRTMGGFDIFISQYNSATDSWGDAKNIGYPINTADDDIYLTWSADGKTGYFSSWREDSYGEKDIYMIRRKESTSNLASLNGRVFNKVTNQPIAATITITDNETHKIVGVYSSNSSTGKYTVLLPHGKNYGVSIDAPGYLFHSENVNVDEGNPFVDHNISVSMEPVKAGSKMVLNNLFFDFDKATLKPESKTELNKIVEFLNEHSEVRIELDGHTDNFGNDAYNQKLSEKRAMSVIEYLKSKGIHSDRMVAKGFGATHPSSTNSTAEGRKLNRRTELKILEQNMVAFAEIDSEDETDHLVSTYKSKPSTASQPAVSTSKPSTTANETTIEEDSDHLVSTYKPKPSTTSQPATTTSKPATTENESAIEEDSDHLVTTYKPKPSSANKPAAITPKPTPVENAGIAKGSKLKPIVHFTYNNTQSLTEYSHGKLLEVVDIMKKNPTMKVKICAYADHVGSTEYNKSLAEKRAATIIKLMVQEGIDKSRLVIENFGEQNELVHTNDHNGNLLNRRVEFFVLEN